MESRWFRRIFTVAFNRLFYVKKMLMIAPQGLEIGEELLWKYDETHFFVFFPWSQIFNIMSAGISTATVFHN